MKSPHISLIGFELAGSENLSLRLLAGFIERAGLRANIVPAVGPAHAHQTVTQAIKKKPLALGLSLQSPEISIHTLAMATLARKRGFNGYIVCGGPFATLQSEWILEKCPAVDGVIKHDGEIPLVELLSALREKRSLAQVPSLVTRVFANPPVVNSNEPNWKPVRGPRPQVMGVPTAEIIAGRGCSDRCDYCTHAAVASLLVRECRSNGVSPAELRQAGMGRPRRRSLADCADEMAELYHEDNVRYFQFVDENPVPKDETAALAWIKRLKTLLSERNVGPVGMGMMTRGDSLTPAVVDALVDLGLVRTLVGLESGSKRGLGAIGRKGDPVSGRRGLDLLTDRGVLTMFNTQLIHPESTVASIRAELEFIETVRGAMFETVQVRPTTGTELNRRLDDENRLSGGTLFTTFESADETVDRFRVLMSRFHAQVLGPYTPTFRVGDLLFSAFLAKKFGRSVQAARLEFQLRRNLDQISAIRVKALLQLLDAAENNDDGDQILDDARAKFDYVAELMERIAGELEQTSSNGGGLARYYRNLVAAAAFVFTLSTSTACYQVLEIPEPAAGESDTSDSGTGDDNEGPDPETDDDNEEPDPETDDDSEEPDSETDDDNEEPDSETDDDNEEPDSETIDDNEEPDSDADAGIAPCEDDPYYEDRSRLYQLVAGNCMDYDDDLSVVVTLNNWGRVVSVSVTGWAFDDLDDLEQCYEALLANEVFPCLSGQESFWYEPSYEE